MSGYRNTPHLSAPSVRPSARPAQWPRILLGGLLLWIATVAVTFLTGNSNLVPTIVLLGSFLVPVTVATRAYERHTTGLGADRILGCFGVGGLIGVLGASVLETCLLSPSAWTHLGVGLIEEAAKLTALVLVSRRLRVSGLRYGLVLGATVGAGFAAFESAGYAFNAVLTTDGLSLRNLVETEILRGVLAPVGHILWTALLGGVLFRERRGGRFRLTPPVLLTYLGVSTLHALWDSTSGIAVWLVARSTSAEWQRALFELGRLPSPTTEQVHLYTLYDTTGLLLVALGGLYWLRRLVRGDRRSPIPTQLPSAPL
ncbi:MULTISPECIES: PrsW family glutamic-type intramembrane protease [Kitasatospora]|uniref:PrsW family glutamic-type intramembrane protease n=1 Tax=Kitasatospora TaxID=2063 RepID=UPI000A983DF9|nr:MULTISPECIES: PrsW family glutamic-type intramembrane protease [Kitasatospora]